MSSIDSAIAAAYSTTGREWRDGPELVYGRMAEAVVALTPRSLAGAVVVDIGAGTGAASRAALAAGAERVVAVDVAPGMLAVDVGDRPAAVVGDARRLPLRSASVDVAIAAFSFNHLASPADGFVEAARVVRPGGVIVASAHAAADDHPAKDAVAEALRARGWEPDPWYRELSTCRTARMATPAGCRDAASAAGLQSRVYEVSVVFSELTAADLVSWRMGMAQHSGFVRSLPASEHEAVRQDAIRSLGQQMQVLTRSINVVVAATTMP